MTEQADADGVDGLRDAVEEFASALRVWGETSSDDAVWRASLTIQSHLEEFEAVLKGVEA